MAVRAARAEGPCPGGKDQDPRRPRRGLSNPWPAGQPHGGGMRLTCRLMIWLPGCKAAKPSSGNLERHTH